MRNGPTPDEADISTGKAILVLLIAFALFACVPIYAVVQVIRWLW